MSKKSRLFTLMLINRSFKPCFKNTEQNFSINEQSLSSKFSVHSTISMSLCQWQSFHSGTKVKKKQKRTTVKKARRSSLPIRKRLPVTQRVTTPYCCPTDNLINYRQISYSLIFYYLKEKERNINPLTPQSDKHPISPNSTSLNSNIKVMRIKEMISNSRSSWL